MLVTPVGRLYLKIADRIAAMEEPLFEDVDMADPEQVAIWKTVQILAQQSHLCGWLFTAIRRLLMTIQKQINIDELACQSQKSLPQMRWSCIPSIGAKSRPL